MMYCVLFGGIGMPSEPFSRLDLIDDSGRRGRAVSAIDRESTSPMNGLVIFRPDFSAFKFIGCNDWIHVPRVDFDSVRVND